MPKKLPFLAVLLLVGFLASTGRTLMIRFNLKDLVTNSDLVLQAKTESIRYAWNEDHTTIFTYVTLSLKEPIVGSTKDNLITVSYPGGQIGEIRMELEDTPTFQTGEEVIVFLGKKNDNGVRRVFGNFQGKFTIENGFVLENRIPVQNFVHQVKTLAAELERR